MITPAVSSQFVIAAPCAGERQPLSSPCRFLSRQPIMDAQQHVFGYELFVRPSQADVCDPELATREAVDHWLMLSPEPEQGCAFVPATRAALIEGLVTLLPAENTILEIDAAEESAPEFLECCLALREKGYRFALDRLSPRPHPDPLVRLADFFRIDFLTCDFEARRALCAVAAHTPVKFIAKNIETDIQMRIARAEGCSLFQGSFFSQPVLVSTRPVQQNHIVYLRLLAALHHSPADMKKVEKLISGDASLCYRVLRLANSAMQGHASPVTTVREALLMVGEDAVRKMATVAVTGALAVDRSASHVSQALSRAHFCELLAPVASEPPAQMYLLGMLSMLDVLLEIPISRILQTLPITPDMKAALTGDESAPGRILALVRSLESCAWQTCQEIQCHFGLEEGAIAATYLDALRWASAMMREMFFSPGS